MMKAQMKYIVVMYLAVAALPAQAQNAYEPYAEDVLKAEQHAEAATHSVCAQVLFGGQEVLTTNEAQSLLCMAAKQLPLALSVMQYGSADRAEVLIGALLQTGVSSQAMGRISTLYDTKQDLRVFTLTDPHHGDAFYKAWQLAFGNEFAREIRLEKDGEELVLDVDGTIRWKAGHIAPTLWVRDNIVDEPQLRVLDPLLSPDKLVSPEEWRRLQNAEPAALVWAAVGEVPVLMVEHLTEEVLRRLKQHLNIAENEPADAAEINRLLKESSPEIRVGIEADALDIPDKAAWHPRNWNEYSLHEDAKQPSWQAGQDDITQQRIEAALKNLELIQAYHNLRASYANDEEFLQDVKRRMLADNKKPKYVVINFDE